MKSESDQNTAEDVPVPLRPRRTIYENNIHTSKATNMLCLFFLSQDEPETHTHYRLSREALIWCIEVFTVVQYGDQMCITYAHNHE